MRKVSDERGQLIPKGKYDAEDDELHGKCVQSSEMPKKSLPILLELYVSSKNCRIVTYVGSNES